VSARPQKGVPALVAAGMQIFAAPEEISKMIEARC
jgi:hypothetical protein